MESKSSGKVALSETLGMEIHCMWKIKTTSSSNYDLNLNAMEVRLKQNTDNMGKFSSFLIYSRKNIKHSENIFHILRAIQNILHGFQQLSSSTDPLTQ